LGEIGEVEVDHDEGDVLDRKARVRLLGPVQLLAGSRVVPVGGPAVRGLLALLALEANRVVGVEEIIDALWAHDPPATARTIVHGNVSHLRRVLRTLDDESARILTAPPGYQLSVDPQQIDVHRARMLMDRAATVEPERRAELLSEAYSLWQGPVLAGVPESIRAPELEELRVAVHGARVDADLAIGRHSELIVELSPLVRVNPFAERTVGQLMRALYHAGRRGDALELYQRVSARVVETLGIDPGAELRRLHDRVLNDDLREPREPVEVVANPAAVSQLPAAVPSLAGRTAELGWLDQGLGRAEAGESVVAVVTGSAGIGKSALVVAWAHQAVNRFPDGVLYAGLRGFDRHLPPFEAADVLTQFLLGLGVATNEVPEHLHERVALYRSLIANRRMLVLLDDARTAEQVRPLLPPGAHSMAVVTSRSRLDGLAVSHAARMRALGTLEPDDAVKLIEELAGPSNYDLNHALARLCGYLPLALRIASARLAAGPQWTAKELVDEMSNERTRLAALDVDGSETSVRAALDVSFRGLPPEVADTFRLFGVLTCASAGPYLVAELIGTSVGEARRRLRTLAGHNLLTETARDVFSPHDLVRLYLRDLAESELTREDREAMLAASVRYYRSAADKARRRLLRIVDPLDFTALLDDEHTPMFTGFDHAQSWFEAEWPNLLATLEAAAAAGLHEDVWQLARIAHTYRVVCPLWDEWTRLVEIGIAAARASGSELGRCWMLISRCAVALTFERPEGSLADAEAALEIATALGDARLVTTAEIHVGCALTLGGRYDEAIERLSRAADQAERTGDHALRGQALNNCAEAEKRAGRYGDAIAHQLASLEIDRKLGDDSYAVVSLNNLAESNLRLGALDDAERYARQAVELTSSRQFTLQEGVARSTLARILREKGDMTGSGEQFALSRELYARAGG
jgi:DNA-binding SARP family transcriptional activator